MNKVDKNDYLVSFRNIFKLSFVEKFSSSFVGFCTAADKKAEGDEISGFL